MGGVGGFKGVRDNRELAHDGLLCCASVSSLILVHKASGKRTGCSEDGKQHGDPPPFGGSFTADHFEKNSPEVFEPEDVDDRLDDAVELGDEEGQVKKLGAFRSFEGSTCKDDTERKDGQKKQKGYGNHL